MSPVGRPLPPPWCVRGDAYRAEHGQRVGSAGVGMGRPRPRPAFWYVGICIQEGRCDGGKSQGVGGRIPPSQFSALVSFLSSCAPLAGSSGVRCGSSACRAMIVRAGEGCALRKADQFFGRGKGPEKAPPKRDFFFGTQRVSFAKKGFDPAKQAFNRSVSPTAARARFLSFLCIFHTAFIGFHPRPNP